MSVWVPTPRGHKPVNDAGRRVVCCVPVCGRTAASRWAWRYRSPFAVAEAPPEFDPVG